MSHYACKISPSWEAWHCFPFGTPDGCSCTFHFRLSSLTFGARWVAQSETVGLWVLLELDESLSCSALLRDTELRELELDSAITQGCCSTAHSTSIKCSAYAVLCSIFYALCSIMLLCSRVLIFYARYYAGIMYASLLVGQMECQNDPSLCLQDVVTAAHNCQHYEL